MIGQTGYFTSHLQISSSEEQDDGARLLAMAK